MRLWDEGGKVPGMATRAFSGYEPLLQRVVDNFPRPPPPDSLASSDRHSAMAMLGMKEIPYPSDAARLSARILDVEHEPNRPILDVRKGIEPTNFGHRRTRCSVCPERDFIPRVVTKFRNAEFRA